VEALYVFIPENLTVNLSLWLRCGSLFNFGYIPGEREYFGIYGEKGGKGDIVASIKEQGNMERSTFQYYMYAIQVKILD
jgi:hypothetical protein